jgi:hypothetical protein
MKHWKIIVMALFITISASAQISRERIFTTPSRSILPIQKTIFNSGGYAIVENNSGADQTKVKKAEATCPAGLKAVSSGFSAQSGRGEPADFRLILSKPKNDGAGWVIYASFDGKGNSLAADIDWDLVIHLVCVKVT